MVVAAISLTLVAVGVGTIYLPFIADKDKIRGLDEDGGVSSQQQQEYANMFQELQAQREKNDGYPYKERAQGTGQQHVETNG